MSVVVFQALCTVYFFCKKENPPHVLVGLLGTADYCTKADCLLSQGMLTDTTKVIDFLQSVLSTRYMYLLSFHLFHRCENVTHNLSLIWHISIMCEMIAMNVNYDLRFTSILGGKSGF